MMRNWISGCAVVCVSIAAIAQRASSAENKSAMPPLLFVRCGRLIADTEKPPLTNTNVVITDGKITSIGANQSAPAGAQTVDFSHDTCLPGLLDAHIHLWTGGFREHPSVSTILGPHIVPAGHAISTIGGHGDFLDMPWQFPLEEHYTPLHGFINSPADAEKAVHLQLKYGARVIKVLASGGVLSPLDSPTAEQLSPEELKVIVEQAHMANVKVAAHAENIRSIMAALEAGVDSIEHGSELNQQAVDFMKAHHVYLDPTLYVVDNSVRRAKAGELPEYVARKGGALAQKTFPSFEFALHAGVTMAAGSDQNYEPGKGTVLDELIALVDHGMPAQQALTAATKHNADLLSLDDLGTIAVGKEGDILAVEGDPLSDIHAVKNTEGVVFKGRLVPAWIGRKTE